MFALQQMVCMKEAFVLCEHSNFVLRNVSQCHLHEHVSITINSRWQKKWCCYEIGAFKGQTYTIFAILGRRRIMFWMFPPWTRFSFPTRFKEMTIRSRLKTLNLFLLFFNHSETLLGPLWIEGLNVSLIYPVNG